MFYLIINKNLAPDGTTLFWCNKHGWVSGGGGTLFTWEERYELNLALPIDGIWLGVL